MNDATPTDQAEPSELAVFKEKLRSVGVMRRTVATSREQQLARDRDAYARLRKEGLQPPTVSGSAALEATSDHVHEIGMGHAFPVDRFPDRTETWKRVDDGMAAAREMEDWKKGQPA